MALRGACSRPRRTPTDGSMSADDVARALMQMSDETTRRRVAEGDTTPFEGLSLTDAETALLVDAAIGDPEVSGYFGPPYVPVGPAVGLFSAIHYAEDGIQQNDVRRRFNTWAGQIKGQGGW